MPKDTKSKRIFSHYALVDGSTGATPHLVSVTGVGQLFTLLEIACHEDRVTLGPKAEALLQSAKDELRTVDPIGEAAQ